MCFPHGDKCDTSKLREMLEREEPKPTSAQRANANAFSFHFREPSAASVNV